MNYCAIKKCDIATGEGVRVSLFVSGCRRHCKGCHNAAAWSFDCGRHFTQETERELLEALAPEYIAGLTLLGGEPFEMENVKGLAKLVRRVRAALPGKNTWCYTGFTYEELAERKDARELLACVDVLVDGAYVESLRDISPSFRGSVNQRVLKLLNGYLA